LPSELDGDPDTVVVLVWRHPDVGDHDVWFVLGDRLTQSVGVLAGRGHPDVWRGPQQRRDTLAHEQVVLGEHNRQGHRTNRSSGCGAGIHGECGADNLSGRGLLRRLLTVMRTTRNWLIIVCCCVAALAGCAIGQPEKSSRVGPIDGPVDVGGGRSIYVKCAGQGSPTVVLIAGKGNGAQDWQDVLAPGDPAHDAPGDDVSAGLGTIEPSEEAVFPSTARFTRVCTYDRPDVRVDGPDITTPRPQPHTIDLDVGDLQALLTAVGEPGPYVLVGHSYGGFIADLFARTQPRSVAGLVMVDAGSPLLADVTDGRRLVNFDVASAMTSPQVREGVKLVDAIEKIQAAPPLPRAPAVVLSADKPSRTDLLPPDLAAIPTITFAQWLAAQGLLARQLDAEHISSTGSGHNIYLYNPALVTDQIGRIVDDLRRQTP
jgi:pimeloyl-ACP methyl ester carboxylesterase